MGNKLVVLEIESLDTLLKQAIHEVLEEKEKNKNHKELMNFKETCDFLGIHPSTLNKWKAENKIPFRRLGKRIFFSREDVLKSLKESNYQKIKNIKFVLN